MLHPEVYYRALQGTLERADLPRLGPVQRGKVRDGYSLRSHRRLLVTTDRISAFDRVLGTIPFKGQVLNQLAAFWFQKTAAEVPNHLLDVPDPNALVGIETTPLPIEFVIRAYATGTTETSLWTHYARGVRLFAGHVLPDGLRRHGRLPERILTPATKALAGAHDETTSRDALLASGVVSALDFDEAARLCLRLFDLGAEHARARGLLLVDAKFEVGRDKDGRLLVIDEVLTPDCARYWLAETYEARLERGDDPDSLDKDYVRRYFLGRGYRGDGVPEAMPNELRVEAARRYVEAYERITGSAFVPADEPYASRMAALERGMS
jgi:phosphoribosylaminoimidazole-succinocarboxamide synthase